MDSFEQAFSDTERAAAATLAAAAALVRQAKALQKAAKEGNIAAIKRQQIGLDTALSNLGQTVNNSVHSWPFQEEQEEQYLREDYADELIQVAAARGMQIHEQDGRLISSPSIVRILAGDRAVWIDKGQTATIRPSASGDNLTSSEFCSGVAVGLYNSGLVLGRAAGREM